MDRYTTEFNKIKEEALKLSFEEKLNLIAKSTKNDILEVLARTANVILCKAVFNGKVVVSGDTVVQYIERFLEQVAMFDNVEVEWNDFEAIFYNPCITAEDNHRLGLRAFNLYKSSGNENLGSVLVEILSNGLEGPVVEACIKRLYEIGTTEDCIYLVNATFGLAEEARIQLARKAIRMDEAEGKSSAKLLMRSFAIVKPGGELEKVLGKFEDNERDYINASCATLAEISTSIKASLSKDQVNYILSILKERTALKREYGDALVSIGEIAKSYVYRDPAIDALKFLIEADQENLVLEISRDCRTLPVIALMAERAYEDKIEAYNKQWGI